MSLRAFATEAYTENMVKATEAGKVALSKKETKPAAKRPLMETAIVTSMKEGRIRVLVIDGHEAVRRALRIRLSAPKQLEVVGVSPDPVAANEQICSRRPDVILLGLHTSSDEELAEMAKAVHDMANRAAYVIVLAPYADAIERELLLNAGAKRYLLKNINSDQLIREIESVVSSTTSV